MPHLVVGHQQVDLVHPRRCGNNAAVQEVYQVLVAAEIRLEQVKLVSTVTSNSTDHYIYLSSADWQILIIIDTHPLESQLLPLAAPDQEHDGEAALCQDILKHIVLSSLLRSL